jgi:hypothetical protein
MLTVPCKRSVYRRAENFQITGSVLVKKSAVQNSSVKQGKWIAGEKLTQILW